MVVHGFQVWVCEVSGEVSGTLLEPKDLGDP